MVGTYEILLIAVVIIVLFGASKIPEIARSLGKATGEFKKGKQDIENELNEITRSARTPENLSKIKKMAQDLGIAIEGKTDDQLLDEIQKKMITIEKKS